MRRNFLISTITLLLFPALFVIVYGGLRFDWNFALYAQSIQDFFIRLGQNLFSSLDIVLSLLGQWGARVAWIASPFMVAGLIYRTKRLADEGRRGGASWASLLAFGSLCLIVSQIEYAYYPLVIATLIASSVGLMWRSNQALVVGFSLSLLNAALLIGGVLLTVQA